MKLITRHVRHVRVLAILALLCVPMLARADHGKRRQVAYVGMHPIPRSEGGGWCYIEAPHVHVYGPTNAKLEYRDHRGAAYFVGDPVAYGYDGPRHVYDGPHPVRVDVVIGDDDEDTEYCFIKGPHYHDYAPAPALQADFKVEGDAYWYVAEPPPAFIEARVELAPINAVYTPIVYDRPVIEVEPPSGWIGARVDFVGPAVVIEPPSAQLVVEAPRPPPVRVHGQAAVGFSAGVELHVPSVQIELGLPSIHIGGGVRHDVVIVRDHRHDDDDDDRETDEHHDHGKHRGWHKHGR